MRRAIALGIGAAGIAALGSLGGCEILTVTALNLVETTEFKVENDVAYMNGEINSKTLEQFESMMAANPGITTIVECSVPGSLDDDTMIPLSYRVRELGLNTHLTATSEIASGGVDFFLAGVNRTMVPGAQVGVHSWSDGTRDAIDYPRDAPEHEANRAYIEQMLGDDGFYWFTIQAAPAADIHWMTPSEISQYGLLTAPPAPATFDCDPHFGTAE
jgi:hypothetical protein